MRGAYTAGCLSWLLDEGIEFDSAYGISVGALHLASYLMGNKNHLHDISTKYINADDVIGVSPLLKEGQIVGYNLLLEKYVVGKAKYNLNDLKGHKTQGYIGLYDLDLGDPIYVHADNVSLQQLKAACSLPIIGHVVKENGHKYLDAGIRDMIPIEQSIKDGNTKHLVITTKPIDYIRKPAKQFVVNLMKMVYPKCPNIYKDYAIRHENYYKQINIINELVKEGNAIYRYPTQTVQVSRLKGKTEDLEKLYQLGRSDMESIREEIYELIK